MSGEIEGGVDHGSPFAVTVDSDGQGTVKIHVERGRIAADLTVTDAHNLHDEAAEFFNLLPVVVDKGLEHFLAEVGGGA